MNRIFMFAGLIAAPFGVASAQTPEARAAFAMADVHVSPRTTNPAMRGGFVRGGRYEIRTATMLDLIRTAWGMDPANISGGPAWLDTDRFDIIAKMPPGAQQDSVLPMLKALLADRFKLEAHNDTKALSGYALSLVKRSSQLKDAEDDGKTGCTQGPQEATSGGVNVVSYSCHNLTMEGMAGALRGLAPGYIGGNTVTDKTGLEGKFDFTLKWVGRAQLANAGSEGISLFAAVEKLGLKLELQNIPLPVLVVDRVNQKPTENAPGVTQSLPAVPLEFEVADIKPSAPGVTETQGGIQPGGRIDFHGVTMKDLLKFAWQIDDNDDDMIVGAPKWLDSSRYDIVAKASTAVTANRQGMQLDEDALSLMLRTLLEQRFRLKVHSDVQPVSVYALVAAKPKLKTADPSNRTSCRNVAAAASISMAPTVLRNFVCQNMSMAQFADKVQGMAAGYLDHPVIDLSGLDGAWDFTLNFSPKRFVQGGGGRGGDSGGGGAAVGAASDPNGAISLFEALDKQLGLKLEVRKHPMPVVVIDHIEEKPTDN